MRSSHDSYEIVGVCNFFLNTQKYIFERYMKRSIESIRARLEKEIDDIRFGSSDVECEVVASVWNWELFFVFVVVRLKCSITIKKTLLFFSTKRYL